MKPLLLAVLSIGAVVWPLSLRAALPAQVPPRCLHGPSEQPDQRTRREQALSLAQQINRAQNTGPSLNPGQRRRFRTFDQLANLPPIPAGFKVQLTTDGATYTFSIKDTLDPCRYAVFSDQDQTLYDATARAAGVYVRPAEIP